MVLQGVTKGFEVSVSRREFLTGSAAASGVALASSRVFAAPYQASVESPSDKGGGTVSAHASGAPLAVPSTMPMGSGAPLGGIGTGFVEIRPDGCFYEWQIFNSGPWAQDARSTTAPPPPGPEYLRFFLRTKKDGNLVPQVRRLYLRADEGDMYTLPFVQDVQGIDYAAWFPMTSLCYKDDTIPVRVSAEAFSPFIPGNARESGTPGFHIVYTIENTSHEPVEVSLAGFFDNPLASALPERRLTNRLQRNGDVTSILFDTAAETDFPSGIGNMCFSVTGGRQSYISGTFGEYAASSSCRWATPRVNYMVLNVLHDYAREGRLPDTECATDPRLRLPDEAAIEALSAAETRRWIDDLSGDALLRRVFQDAQSDDKLTPEERDKALLKEVRRNLTGKGESGPKNWGTGLLASSVRLKPGEAAKIRFTLSWYFPHHLTTSGHEMGHMYANWFKDSEEVNQFLCTNYQKHRAVTETFAHTLADTSLGDAMAFSWSGQLSTMVFNTWWTKDGSYAIWEGLGCCGLSTMDVDYQGSFPAIALFPDLKLAQMKRILAFQNEKGQVPHNYAGDMDRIDESGYARVDMNPQFVMMVCRDYLWTGDKDYLKAMWPHIVRAMAFTESLDTNKDALPDQDTGLQTYDQWRMRGTPAYIASLWLGALRAAVRIAQDIGKTTEAQHWEKLLERASSSFDAMLYNGDYYSLWVDGKMRDELCMSDQISGEWFAGLIGLPTTLDEAHLKRALDSILRYNFNPEFGLHNATAPKKGLGLLALNNLQAGGLWSGIEFAFASLLMDQGRYADGLRIVEAVHRRYLRAGQPWNHVECGGHYSRAMSSWATLLAATGFKPDLAHGTLTIQPTVSGDFHAPWVTPTAFGTIDRNAGKLAITCVMGKIEVRSLRVGFSAHAIYVDNRVLTARTTAEGKCTRIDLSATLTLEARQTLSIR